MVYDHLDMADAAREALFAEFKPRYAIMIENVAFEPPANGATWLKFDYIPASKEYRSLDRKCITLTALVQVGIVFSPDTGITAARALAKEIANFFKDGKILNVGYIFEGASSHPVQKSERGWFLPVRFTMRYDEKEK